MTLGNWKTSLSGVLAAAAGFVAFSPSLFARWPWVVDLARYVMVGGLAGMGFAAKDVNGAPSDKTQQIEDHLNAVDAKTEDMKGKLESSGTL